MGTARDKGGADSICGYANSLKLGCSAAGAWLGSVAGSGTRAVNVGAAGNYDFSLQCQNAAASSAATLSVLAQ